MLRSQCLYFFQDKKERNNLVRKSISGTGVSFCGSRICGLPVGVGGLPL